MILQIVHRKMLLMFYPDWDWYKNHQFKNEQMFRPYGTSFNKD
jgi:hypothetical protein